MVHIYIPELTPDDITNIIAAQLEDMQKNKGYKPHRTS